MKLAIVAEGEAELGALAHGHEGTAAIWIRRLLGAGPAELELVRFKLSGGDVQTRPRPRRGEAETAQVAYHLAARAGCDGVVLFRDADGDAAQRRDDNLRGLTPPGPPSIPSVLGLQVNMLEAWLLADPGAYQRAFGRVRPPIPRRPEDLWGGRNDAAGNHPKHVYRRVLSTLNIPPGGQTVSLLAEHANLDVLARECPEGFGRFKMDFEHAFRPFTCVVAADLANGIGKSNDLPWPKLKADLKHFRDVTSTAAAGKRNAVIMGRKTWDSVPEKYRPLAGRLNVVVSRGDVDLPDGVLLARSLDDALTQASLAPDVDRLMVVGGGEIYRQAFEHPRCGEVYLTRIDQTLDCDTFIPDVTARFELAEPLGRHHDAGFDYRIERWTRPRPRT